jgi:hypothetical protein
MHIQLGEVPAIHDLRFAATGHYCMCVDVVGSRPLKRPHQLAIARRQAHSTSMGRQAERNLQDKPPCFFYAAKFATKLASVSRQNLKCTKV